MPTTGRTIGDAIKAKSDAEAAKAKATDDVAAANRTLTEATDTDARAFTELAADLFSLGTVFRVNADGTAEVYTSDSQTSYHHFNARPESTPVAEPAPAPTPAPAPPPEPPPPAMEPTP